MRPALPLYVGEPPSAPAAAAAATLYRCGGTLVEKPKSAADYCAGPRAIPPIDPPGRVKKRSTGVGRL